MKGFDYSHFSPELTIGCNEEHRWGPKIALTQDVRGFVGEGPKAGYRDMTAWHSRPGMLAVYFKGHPDRENLAAPDTIYQAESCHTQENPFAWAKTIEGGLTYGANTGIAALSLADVLGASPIYLLGFDCGFGPRGETHSHDRYPEHWALPRESQETVYDRWVKEFARHAPSIRGKVIAVGPTALDCFKRISHGELMEELLK